MLWLDCATVIVLLFTANALKLSLFTTKCHPGDKACLKKGVESGLINPKRGHSEKNPSATDKKLSRKLPPFLTKCHQEDSACLKKGAEDGLIHMKSGYPEKNFPPIDPITDLEFEVEPGEKLFVAPMKYSNAKITGQSKAEILGVEFDLKIKNFALDIDIEDTTLEGNYSLEGKIFGKEVKSTGYVVDRILNLVVHMRCGLEEFEKDSEKFVRLRDCHEFYDSVHLNFTLSGLPEDIKTELYHREREVFNDLSPKYAKPYSEIKMNMINTLFENTPLSELIY